MLIKIKHRFILGLCLVLISACSFTDRVSVPTVPTAETIIAGLCDNSLYPVKQNASWTYAVSGNGDFTYTETITSVSSSGFILTTQFNNSASSQEWVCETGGLKAIQMDVLNYLSSPSSAIEVTGVSIPKELISGMQWLYSLNLEQGTYTVIMQEMGNENITVPAGAFDATKFQATQKYESSDAQSSFTVTSFVWYAKNVGLIKTVDDVQKSDGAFSVTTELSSYSIP